MKINKLEFCIFILLFGLLAVFLIHNFDSIGQDIGRHLKVGEIIWQTKSVPNTNLFSFTEPDFSFINHHWLSEVIFYSIFSWSGFTGLILLKIFLILATFSLLFFTVKPLWITDIASRLSTGSRLSFWSIIVSFLLSIFIFISRTEVRPEIFSFLILVFYLFVLFKAKYSALMTSEVRGASDVSMLWFLPVAQLLWVNLHIYFFIGPTLFFFFLIDRFVEKKRNSKPKTQKFLVVFSLIILATFINPAGIHGALLPFNILKEYGYSIIENQTLAFLTDLFGFNLPIFIFKVSVAVLAVSFVVTFKNLKNRVFEILVSASFVYAGFKMLRNLPLYALASFPVLAILLKDVINDFDRDSKGGCARLRNFSETSRCDLRSRTKRKLTTSDVQRTSDVTESNVSRIFKIAIVGFLIFMIFFVASGGYYKQAGLSRAFGFSVPNGLERAASFVKENRIKGPMFNNFDVGGYLIWKLPEEKVFVDNRPEAYSVEFFKETYKPMQEDGGKWPEFSEKYGINFVFFGYSDATPWGQTFITNIIKNPGWKVVYINEEVIILIKNSKNNSAIISKFSILRENAVEKTLVNIKESNENNTNLNITLSRFFYNIGWHEASVYFADEAIKLEPNNPHPYLYKGLVYAFYTDKQNQKLAGDNIKKAIDLGLKESRYYYILGVVYMNLGRLDEAKVLFEKALELDKNNTQAKEFLEKYF